MHKNSKLIRFLLCLSFTWNHAVSQTRVMIKDFSSLSTGDAQFGAYLGGLKNKRVGIVTNVTGVIGNTTIVDTLLKLGVKVKRIFGPEHGFRSNTDAGEIVKNNRDSRTGLPVVSLYGSNKKPTKEQLKDIDLLLYDIQDVGVRFYTYISTMCYAMEACAENNREMIVLDRPNPNGFYVDGPVLTDKYTSFLGMHHVPIVYGMTCGEYAMMANNEGWLKGGKKCSLTVIPLKNYDRKASYRLPVRPSPNLPNSTAVLLYPGLGLFEGTIMSVGRGTDFPFQVIGNPEYPDTGFCFVPGPTTVSKEPRYVGRKCCGLDLRNDSYIRDHPQQISLHWLIHVYNTMKHPGFFEENFNYHAGNALLQEQIRAGLPEEVIRKSWQEDLDKFRRLRKKYLLYPDFE